jgi:hypothetical protein
MIDYDDLYDARAAVNRQARRQFKQFKAIDTSGPSVEAALHVVEFEVIPAREFARDVIDDNIARVHESRGSYRAMLFAACYMSGMTTGAMARARSRD